MLAEMALIATGLGPAASSKAWFLVLFCGECTDIEAFPDGTSEVFSCSLPLAFRRKKDMAGPGSGRRARGDWRGEGPAPLIQQPARTSGCAAAAALARQEPLLPGVGPAASSRRPGSSRRHIINKPPAEDSATSPLSPLASRRSVPPARLLPPPPPPSAGRFHRGKGIVSYVRYPEPPLFRPLC